jgi:hypothetical protein
MIKIISNFEIFNNKKGIIFKIVLKKELISVLVTTTSVFDLTTLGDGTWADMGTWFTSSTEITSSNTSSFLTAD